MSNTSSDNYLIQRRRFILLGLIFFSGAVGALSLFVVILNYLGLIKTLSNTSNQLTYATVSLVVMLIAGLAYWLVQRNQARAFQIGAYVIIGLWTSVVFILSLLVASSALSFLLPLLFVGMLLSPQEIIGWTGGFCVLAALTNILVSTGAVPSVTLTAANAQRGDGVFISVLYLFLTGASFWFLQINVRTMLTQSNNYVQKLSQLSDDREQKRQLGVEVGQNVRQQALELADVSVQHETGISKQVTVVTELVRTMEQLNTNALYVAESSQEAAQVAKYTRNSAESVKAAAEKAAQTTQHGLTVTAETKEAILSAQGQISQLEIQVGELVRRSSQISRIVELMSELADETHLLSLNAAIESAGAGEYGVRFAVVADEVKHLADRSLQATREVQVVISQLQDSITEINTVTTQAHQECETAAKRSQQSGKVVSELGQVIEVNSKCANDILTETLRVSNLMSDIARVNGTQQITTDEITRNLREVDNTARTNAHVTRQLNQAVVQLEILSNELTTALATAEDHKPELASVAL